MIIYFINRSSFLQLTMARILIVIYSFQSLKLVEWACFPEPYSLRVSLHISKWYSSICPKLSNTVQISLIYSTSFISSRYIEWDTISKWLSLMLAFTSGQWLFRYIIVSAVTAYMAYRNVNWTITHKGPDPATTDDQEQIARH